MKLPIRRYAVWLPGTPLAVAAVVVPLIQGGTPRLPTFILHVCLLLFIGLTLAGRAPSVCPGRRHPVEPPAVAMAALACLSFLTAPYHHDAEHYFLLILLYAATFLLLARRRRDFAVRALFAGMTCSALIQAGVLAFEVVSSDRQPQGTFDNPNFLAGFLAAVAGIHLARAIGLSSPVGASASRVPSRVAAWVMVAVLVAAVIWTRSRGGVLALGVSMTCLLVIRFGWRALAAPVAAAVIMMSTPNPWRERVSGIGSRDVYAFSRADMWVGALRMLRDHPLAGVGLGQFQYFSPRYAFPVEGHWARYAKITDNPHSEPLLAAAEMGFPAAAVLAWFLGASALAAFRAPGGGRRRFPWQAAVLAGVGVQAAVDFSLHSPAVVLAAVGLLASWVGEDRRAAASGRRMMEVPAHLRVLVAVGTIGVLFVSARTLIGFVHYLKAGGGPVDLLDEKSALARWGRDGAQASAAELDRALRWDPDCAPYHAARGSLAAKSYADTGDPAALTEAFDRLGMAISLNPNNEAYLAHRTELLLSLVRRGERGREAIEAARDDLRLASTVNPVSVALRDKLARTCLLAGDLEEAASHFGESVRLEPCFLKGYLGLGLVAKGSGDFIRAGEYLRLLEEKKASCPQGANPGGYEASLVDLDDEVVDNLRRELREGGGASPPRERRDDRPADADRR